jgi:hypothetical protein
MDYTASPIMITMSIHNISSNEDVLPNSTNYGNNNIGNV